MLLLDAYHEHATRYYRDADGPTSTMHEIRVVIRVRGVVRHSPRRGVHAAEDEEQRCKGWVVAECSRRSQPAVGHRQADHKWAASENSSRVGASRHFCRRWAEAWTTHDGAEMEPVEPVDDAVVDATLPHLSRFIRGMVEVGDSRRHATRRGICSLRRSDIDTGGDIWLYRPPKHKNTHREVAFHRHRTQG